MAFAKLAAGDDFCLELVVISEKEMLPDPDFAAGADQAFPFIGVVMELAGEQDLHASVKKIAGGGIAGADRLRIKTCASSEEAGGKHTCVVEDDKIVGSEEVGEFAELTVGDGPGRG